MSTAGRQEHTYKYMHANVLNRHLAAFFKAHYNSKKLTNDNLKNL